MSNQTTGDEPRVILPRRSRWRGAGMLAVGVIIFVCGGITGWGTAMLIGPPRPRPDAMQPDPPVREMVRRLRDELLLTDDQLKKVTDIYNQRYEALRSIRTQMLPQLKSQYDQLREQIKGVLTAPQFEVWDRRYQSVRNRMLPPPPPPPNNGPGGPGGRGGPEGPGGGPGGPDRQGQPPGDGPPPRPGPPMGF